MKIEEVQVTTRGWPFFTLTSSHYITIIFMFKILSGSGSRSTAVAKLANSKLDRLDFLCSLNQTFVFTLQTSLV
nr:hypothetical protein Q903MT_gene3327 [Picea sitchensis]